MKTTAVHLFMCFSLVYAGERKSGKIIYKLNFDNKLIDCADFTNEVMDATDIEMIEDSASSSHLTGTLKLKQELADGTKVTLTAYKITDVGNEFFYEIDGDMCEKITDKDTPWAPLFEAIGVTSCPIEAKDYAMNNLQLNLDYAKDFMNHEFCGSYFATMSLLKLGETPDQSKVLSCYGMYTSVIEVKEEEGEE